MTIHIKNSLDLKTSRYSRGGVTETSKFSNEWWEKKIITGAPSDLRYTVSVSFEGRLDLISYAFYQEWRYWWIIARRNNILDPINEVIEGKELFIPSFDRIKTEILTGLSGGIPSTRQEVSHISPIIV